METRTVSLDSLLTDGLFDIPSYQRSYSWTSSQLQDLLDDTIYPPDDSSHFFGNVILDQQEDQYRTGHRRRFNVFDVVDGQERLISALIFLHTATAHDETVADTLSEDNLIVPVRERPQSLPQDQDKSISTTACSVARRSVPGHRRRLGSTRRASTSTTGVRTFLLTFYSGPR